MTVANNIDEGMVLVRARRLCKTGQAKSIRLAAGLSQHEVGHLIGVSGATVSRWEAGHRVPHGHNAVRYGELLSRLMAL